LIAAMTVGAAVLLGLESWFFPKTPQWSDNVALTAERGVRIDEVEVAFAASETAVDVGSDSDDSLCEIDLGGAARWEPRGPRVRLFVIGAQGDTLSDAQKRTLLDALGSLSQAGAQTPGAVPVRLAADCGIRLPPEVPEPAKDLCNFLIRKGFVQAVR
jgi:hypothetical protein